jgi:cytochrome c peroxidase
MATQKRTSAGRTTPAPRGLRIAFAASAVLFGVVLASVLGTSASGVHAQGFTPQFELGLPPSVLNGGLGSMRTLPVPQPGDNGTGGDALSVYVANQQALVVLGKALFWEQSIGSDGIACASCHFHAGADNRLKNSLDPDLRGAPSGQFNPSTPTASGGDGGPNYTLTAADFPFHQLLNPLDRNSAVMFESFDVVSSQGVFATQFVSSGPRRPLDSCSPVADPNFMVGGIQTRRVEPRNTPTVIGAAFNYRNFWDGRANNRFNGANPFGRRDASARVWRAQNNGKLVKVIVDLSNSSLASQAVGPPGSDFEMSCGGRSFAAIGHKVLPMRPLAAQVVDATDSVLGTYRSSSFPTGLKATYAALVQAAFQPAFWSSKYSVVLDPANPTTSTFTQMEANFALFFGLAIQEYEKTLIPSQTRFDAYAEAAVAYNSLAVPGLTDQEKRGLAIFEGDGIDPNRYSAPDGRCSRCHMGPEFSSAATHQQALVQAGGLVERMTMGDLSIALYDSGFYNIGVTPTSRDLGIGVLDPFGYPLSHVGEAKNVLMATGSYLDCSSLTNQLVVSPDPIVVKCSSFVEPGWIWSTFRDATDGAFKVPTLRNIALTGPYFHNGSRATLEQVIEFYNRGGDRQGPLSADTSGFGINPVNADPDIEVLNLTPADQAALVAFLKTLTDPRVANEEAPFDHPSLVVTNGHAGDNAAVVNDGYGKAVDLHLSLPATGKLGRSAKGLPPIAPFLR